MLFYCRIYSAAEPGVPYNITVRGATAVGKGEPVSMVVFAVQQGNFEKLYKSHDVLIVPIQEEYSNLFDDRCT